MLRSSTFACALLLVACSGGNTTTKGDPKHAPGPDAGVAAPRPPQKPTYVTIATLTGTDDARLAQIRARLEQDYQGLGFCYQKQVATNGDKKLEGTIDVEVVIAPDGRVSTSTGRGLPFVDQCVAAAISAMEFGIAKAGAQVKMSFTAAPNAEADAASAAARHMGTAATGAGSAAGSGS